MGPMHSPVTEEQQSEVNQMADKGWGSEMDSVLRTYSNCENFITVQQGHQVCAVLVYVAGFDSITESSSESAES